MPAYDYPLLVKQLLITPLAHKTPGEIVYGDARRYGYPAFRERIGRLGSALSRIVVGHGDAVAVMDSDSHRDLECYFTVPMLGAVLQTVNVRLSPEQVLCSPGLVYFATELPKTSIGKLDKKKLRETFAPVQAVATG
jgi:fatty-acyl-CoA synthase